MATFFNDLCILLLAVSDAFDIRLVGNQLIAFFLFSFFCLVYADGDYTLYVLSRMLIVMFVFVSAPDLELAERSKVKKHNVDV